MAADRGHHGFERESLSTPKTEVDPTIVNRTKTANVMDGPGSNVLHLSKQNWIVSLAFGSSFRDMSLASGIW